MTAHAQGLPSSAACQTALQALAEAEDTLRAASAASAAGSDEARRRAVERRLYPQRQRVADLCLGGLTTSPPPSQRTWVSPSSPARSELALPRVAQPAIPPVVLPPPRVEAPVTITHCSAATCLASDGSTLTRVGPTLLGLRGACQAQGVFVRCP